MGYFLGVTLTQGLGSGLEFKYYGIYIPGAGLSFTAAYGVSLCVLILWGFLYNYFYNFKTIRPMREAFVPYLGALGISAAVNYATAVVFESFFPAMPAIAVGAGMLAGGAVKFLLYHCYVFPLDKVSNVGCSDSTQ